MRPLPVAGATFIAFAVSAICLLPPGLHFLTGPLGPLIGGYVVGSRFRLNVEEALVVGLSMGVAMGAFLVASFEFLAFMPSLPLQASLPLGAVAGVYFGLLGGLGAWFAGSRVRES